MQICRLASLAITLTGKQTMFNKLKSIQQEDAFTLIELLVVILIIGILAGIAIPVFLNQQKAAINASLESDVHNTQINAVTFMTENPWASSSNNVFATGPGGEKFAFATTNPTPNLVISDDKTTLAVKFFGNGNYKVEGYNPNAKKVYSYDSTTGKYSEVDQGIATAVSPDKGAALGNGSTTPDAGSTTTPGTGSTTPPATTAPTTPTSTLLKKYTFEGTGSGSTEGFKNSYSSTLSGLASGSGEAKAGRYSIYMSDTSSAAISGGQEVSYVVGQKYRATINIKQTAGNNSQIGIAGVYSPATSVAAGAYTQITLEFTAKNTSEALTIFTNKGTAFKPYSFVDEISIEKI